MVNFHGVIKLFALAALVIFMCEGQAHAYLDPGSGSYLLQMLIAGLLGAAFAIKMYWRKIVGFFKGLFSKK